MNQAIRCFKAEFKKRKRSLFLYIHLFVPITLSGVLVMYILARNGGISLQSSYTMFFELIGVGTPVIISIICGIVADTENEAGNFQNILGVIQNKTIAFLSQVSMMILSYFFAILLTIFTYIIALKYIVGIGDVQISLYLLTGFIFAVSVSFQYFFYLVIGYNYGIGMCSISGFAGLIIAALSLTSIGDKVWVYLPWSWPSRFTEFFLESSSMIPITDYDKGLFKSSIIACVITIIVILLSIYWFNNWYGRRTND
ncbi:lantibiotic immunity ABC transporter MutG family permease subunit [Caldalkalibacillus mannanilyticus]|uniref:lantibiotic immunity ABC transporter MutG family permease subunit n=1 Tax=Caldalkalibacillus mannanilyticus TaxID=1418 RepID=UPI000468EDCB|nr:lantibiotic immunity ABC transporter MutG family permease subunit [Caldalkalibacillus mannanilyticus]